MQLNALQPGFWLLTAAAAFVLSAAVGRNLETDRRVALNVLRWLTIPYLALMSGAVSPRLMGLTQIDWVVTLGFGVILMVSLAALLALSNVTLPSVHLTSERSISESTVLFTVLVCGTEQFYWSFLRGSITEILILSSSGFSPVGYWACWFAAFLLLPEVIAQRLTPAGRLAKLSLVVLTTILFIYTRNFWLCWTTHATLWLIFGRNGAESGGNERNLRPTTRRQ